MIQEVSRRGANPSLADYCLLESTKEEASRPVAVCTRALQNRGEVSDPDVPMAVVVDPVQCPSREVIQSQQESSPRECSTRVEVIAGLIAAVVIIGGSIYFAALIESNSFFPQS